MMVKKGTRNGPIANVFIFCNTKDGILENAVNKAKWTMMDIT